jgi:holo-ACP synthase / triphosphoribosyl-dephospho-CoA synthase
MKRQSPNMDQFLHEKEQIQQLINKDLKVFDQVVTLCINTPGPNKYTGYSRFLLRMTDHVLCSKGYQLIRRIHARSGPINFYYHPHYSAQEIKTELMKIEDSATGRFLDLDVYTTSQLTTLSRHKARKCYLCDKDAFVCRKEQTHSTKELLSHMSLVISTTFGEIISTFIQASMEEELNLHPKFGLVTPFTSGSHRDMTYEVMKQSIEFLSPKIARFFFQSFEELDETKLFQNARMMGQEIEQAMFEQSHGINTYKGLIFHLGLILLAQGLCYIQFLPSTDLFTTIKRLASPLTSELGKSAFSTGSVLQARYPHMGAKVEAIQGYPHVQELLHCPLPQDESELLFMLVKLIVSTEDSVLLKRAKSMERYQEIKLKFFHLDPLNSQAVALLDEWSIKQGLSYGGAADLLVVCRYLQRSNALFFDDKGATYDYIEWK